MESEPTLNPIIQKLKEIMEIEGVPWIVYTAALVCLVLVAVYVVGLFRNMAIGEFSLGTASSEEDLDLIREIRNRDMIADEEFDRAKQLIREKEATEIPSSKESTDRSGDSDEIKQ